MTAIGKIYEVRGGCSLRLPPGFGRKEGDPMCLWAMPGQYVVMRHPLHIRWASRQMDKLVERHGIPETGKPAEVANLQAQKAMDDYDAEQSGVEPKTAAQSEADEQAGDSESAPGLVDDEQAGDSAEAESEDEHTDPA